MILTTLAQITCLKLSAGPNWQSFEKFRTEGVKALESVKTGTVATLNGYGGSQFIWSPINSLSSTFNQQVTANPTVNTTYMLVAIDSCGIDTAFFDVIIPNDSYQILNDTVICRDDSLFLFADGGITALGLSIFNMSVISVWVGYGVFLLVKKILPKTKASIVIASGIGALISVPAAALGFTLQYAIGATGTFSVTSVLSAMVGTHILIGIGEAIITGLTVSAVIASRSDLVYGWKDSKTQLEIRHG